MADNSITSGSIPKQLLNFFFPIWFGTFFQQLYNTADAVIVGNFVGKEALAAVGGPTSAIINLSVGFFTGLASGASVIIAQYYGARDFKRTNDAVHTAMAFSIIGGILLTFLGVATSPFLLRITGTPEDIMGPSVTYLNIYFLGVISNLVFNIGSGILRAVGDSKRPLYFLIICSLVNIVFDLLFVAVWNMGVAGVGYATVLAQVVSSIFVIASLMKPRGEMKLELRKITLHKEMVDKMFKIGIPAGLQSALYSVSNLLIQAGINSFGTDVVAAWTAYSKMDAIYWNTINSFGVAVTTFAGQNFGAGNYDRVKKSTSVCMIMALTVSVSMSVILIGGGPWLYRMFTPSADIIEIGMYMLKAISPFYFCYVAVEVFSGTLRGVGDIFVPTMIVTVLICGLRTGWLFMVLPFHRTLFTLMLSYPVSWTLASLTFIVYYKRGKWLTNAIAKKDGPKESL